MKRKRVVGSIARVCSATPSPAQESGDIVLREHRLRGAQIGFRPIPPREFQQFLDDRFVKPLTNKLGGHAAHDGIIRYVVNYHGPRRDDSPDADLDAAANEDAGADPDIVTNVRLLKLLELVLIGKGHPTLFARGIEDRTGADKVQRVCAITAKKAGADRTKSANPDVRNHRPFGDVTVRTKSNICDRTV